ncbi:MAG: Cerebroside-sulfatase, partial [Kiritimatiellia bacterium]
LLELYNLDQDIGETTNVAEAHPEIVQSLLKLIEACRKDLGDEHTGTPAGPQVRPVGRVDQPRTLTQYDPAHPYIQAEYDLADCG